MTFQPGQSGNPGGRPKQDPELKAMFQAKGLDAYERIVRLMDSDNEKIALAAAQTLLERGYGKAAQETTIKGSVTEPLEIHQTIELVDGSSNSSASEA